MNDVWTAILGLASGLAIFLYSMKMTSGSLEALAGNKLKGILAKLTSNRFAGIAVGAGITALIQSSSATTVMVIGFVNAGLMNLYQALWIIMGANIGTNITTQLIAFDVGAFAPIVALAGAFICIFAKDKKLRNVGEAITGLGFIFVSMSIMSKAMAPLCELDSVKHLFASINNPFLGILVGMGFVALIQSSAAGIGVLQAMAMAASGAGIIDLDQAMFMIFGMNIGTCVTAMLASIGASRIAIRAALMHLTFNIIGTIIFTTASFILPISDWVKAMSPDNVARQFANMHLIFNVVSTIILLPCGSLIVRLVNLILPDKGGEGEGRKYLKYLKPSMLSQDLQLGTSVLIMALTNEIGRMLVLAGENVKDSLEAVLNNSDSVQTSIDDTEEYIDYLNKEISFYISHVMMFELDEKDAATMSALFKITGNIERMGDHATNIAGYAKMLEEKGLKLSEKAQEEVGQMKKVTSEAYSTLISAKPSSVLIKMAQIEQKIDDMTDDYREHQLERLKTGHCSGDACVVYSEMLTDFERLGDHMLNIAEAAAETEIQSFGTEGVEIATAAVQA